MAASLFRKPGKVSVPKKPRFGSFAKVGKPKLEPLKTRFYTKDVLKQDPTEFGSFGFGDTGLHETPSILGMSRPPKGRGR